MGAQALLYELCFGLGHFLEALELDKNVLLVSRLEQVDEATAVETFPWQVLFLVQQDRQVACIVLRSAYPV